MCNFFSAIATKDKLHVYYGVDAHEDIIELSGLRDDKQSPDFVRLELLPNFPMTLDFEKWKFHVDQDILPDWFVPDEWHKKMIEYLGSVPQIRQGEEVKIVVDRLWFCWGTIKSLKGFGSILHIGGSATIQDVWGSATIQNVRDSATIQDVRNSATIQNVRDSATIQNVWDFATIQNVRDFATIQDDRRIKPEVESE